ncbi:dynein axonemal intermediate chain 7 isoform X2 [Protopterus annectens]|nr:dynein axonemal intermediate chain 7 isoform X2 [Protopterus annectens]
MSSGKKKGGKLSRAERERLQKEEEERLKKEEEEARLKAEQEEAERLERQQREKEARERLEAKDRERRDGELTELRLLLEDNQYALDRWYREMRQNAKWDRYMRCDGTPDPAVLPEINTYVNLWMDNQNVNIASVLQESKTVLNLISELEFLLSDTPPEELNEKDAMQYQETTGVLKSLLHKKLNEATFGILKTARISSDIETGNMQQVIEDENITLCIWANLNKNPRFKGYTFVQKGIGFELPKPLALCDVAVRIMYTCFDHLSHLAPIYPHKIKESPDTKSDIAESESKEEDEKLSQTEHTEKVESLSVDDEDTKSIGRKSVMSSVSAKEETRSLAEGKTKSEQADKKEDHVESSEVQSTPVLLLKEPEEEVLDLDTVDLCQFKPLGGVYNFDVLKLPPQPKQINRWTMVQILDTGIEIFPYPPDPLKVNSSTTKTDDKESETLIYPPVGITVKIPSTIAFFEEPQIARWDPAGKCWKTDCISDVKYSKDEQQISFKMTGFYTFTLMQDMHFNMPYQAWELRPQGLNGAILIIETSFIEVQIQIKNSLCRLSPLPNEETDNLAHIRGKWMTPASLTTAMKNAGVNISPEDYSRAFVSVNKKNLQAEEAAYDQMALLSSAFAFSWSKWNLTSGHNHIVLQVSEHLKMGPVMEENWSLYLLSAQRAERLKITELSDEFSDELAEQSEFHSTFYHMIKDDASEAAMEMVKNTHYLFVNCVHKLLTSTKVLTYS